MKSIKRFFVVLALSFVALWGCSETVSPLQQYYALTTVLSEKAQIESAYITDDKKFNERVAEIEKLIDDSSKIKLESEEDTKIQTDLTQAAKNHIKSIKNLRTIAIKSNKKEKNDDFSLIDEYNKVLSAYDKTEGKLLGYCSNINIEVPDNERTEKLSKYIYEFDLISVEVTSVGFYKVELDGKDNFPTNKEIKKMKDMIKKARQSLEKLKSVAVDKEDQDVKDYKEMQLKKLLDNYEKSIKYMNNGDAYKNNQIVMENNIYEDRAERDIYYNMLVLPNLPEDE